MHLDREACIRALDAHDERFDGVFFVGVRSTGIYCRPICPARPARRDRIDFFRLAAEAEHAGFRACFRCRPELAPGGAPVDALSRLARDAVQRIDAGFLNEHSLEALADSLGVTSRHLRRAVTAECGVSPVELAQSRRMALAKQLLHDTSLPLAEVAFASGFSSVRRFNALFQQRFARSPGQLRRSLPRTTPGDALTLRLDTRGPFAWEPLLRFLEARAIPGVEAVRDGAYLRTVRLGKCTGWVRVRENLRRAGIIADVSLALAPALLPLVARLRALFDLDAQPTVIATHLRKDARLAAALRRWPGLRVPGAFDGFELALRAVLGQQVTVRGATTLSGRAAEAFGEPLPTPHPELHRVTPTADALASAGAARIQALGMPRARAEAVAALARAVADGTLRLEGHREQGPTVAALQALPGIGPWTAQYVSMRALRWPDAFPAGDLALRKALRASREREVEARAERWRPWRAYAAMHLWMPAPEKRRGGLDHSRALRTRKGTDP
jgi:AraC family transcriptional regulator of adaptative response / DNA-3-methyladenine glycosylase II